MRFLNVDCRKGNLRFCIFGMRFLKIKLSTLLRFGIYSLSYKPDFTCVKKQRSQKKEVLIIKTDSIGDYVLMRNFWKVVQQSEKFKDAKITLILSSAVKGLAELLDGDDVDKIFYVPHPFWRKSTRQKAVILSKLFKEGLKTRYDAILFPNINRLAYEDFNILIAQNIAANETIIQLGEMNVNNHRDMKRNYLFTHVVSNYEAWDTFEFFGNRTFFERACECQVDLTLPEIVMEKHPSSIIVINPSSQEFLKIWHPNNWVRIIELLIAKYQKDVVLIGSRSESDFCLNIHNQLSSANFERCRLAINKSWREVISLINDAALFMGNDSACFHIAVACKTKAICLTGGSGFQRFTNYPKSSRYEVLLAPETKTYLKNADSTKRKTFVGAVNSITIQQVIQAVEKLL